MTGVSAMHHGMNALCCSSVRGCPVVSTAGVRRAAVPHVVVAAAACPMKFGNVQNGRASWVVRRRQSRRSTQRGVETFVVGGTEGFDDKKSKDVGDAASFGSGLVPVSEDVEAEVYTLQEWRVLGLSTVARRRWCKSNTSA